MQALSQIWSTFSVSQKILVLSVAASVVVLSAVVTLLASRPDYTILFSNMKAEDAAQVAEKLRDQKIRYRLAANGTAIEVPSKDVHNARLSMASQGLPAGGSVGFEIFDKSSLGVTDFSQKMSYLRALQGELQRTISSMDPVQDARVHIVIPSEKLFTEDQAEASASVVVTLRGGATLSQPQISSIVNLVSASVEGLRPERVNLVDTAGKLLADGSGDDAMGLKMSSTQLDIKRSIERGIQRDVETMLDQVVGPGKAVVRVNTRVSFDQKETTSELFEPAGGGNQGIITKEERIEESYAGGPGIAGIPGTATNLQPAQNPAPAQANRGYSRTQNNTNYSVSKRFEKTSNAPGKVEQVNVAVLLDKEVGMAKVASIQEAVAAAAGIDAARGDRVVVQTMEFPKAEAPGRPGVAAAAEEYLRIGRPAIAVILLLIFAMFIKGAVSKQTAAITSSLPASVAVPASDNRMAAGASGTNFDAHDEAEVSIAKLIPPQAMPELPVDEAQAIAKDSPETVATIVRSWLAEDRKAA